jgi:xanthine dehydrogenase YagS FAD-binding subunit
MRPFTLDHAASAQAAIAAARPVAGAPAGPRVPPTAAPAQFIAGGTQMLDLMKLDVMQPAAMVDINALAASHGRIEVRPDGLHLGALVRMSEAGAHPAIQRDYPVIAETLLMAASPQLRNMASLGGNVLQRTRCTYFRDAGWTQCNKREPGSGCAALDGVNRKHAVLGVSDRCIAAYSGDFAQALVALGAEVQTAGANGSRTIAFADLHTGSDNPHTETVLAPGELITGFRVPAGPWTRRSAYVKVRDRESYAYGLATAAVALDLQGGVVREARIGLGAVSYKPWRAHEAEAALRGKPLTEDTAAAAAQAAFAGARPRQGNAYLIDLGRRTLARALMQAGRMEA